MHVLFEIFNNTSYVLTTFRSNKNIKFVLNLICKKFCIKSLRFLSFARMFSEWEEKMRQIANMSVFKGGPALTYDPKFVDRVKYDGYCGVA